MTAHSPRSSAVPCRLARVALLLCLLGGLVLLTGCGANKDKGRQFEMSAAQSARRANLDKASHADKTDKMDKAEKQTDEATAGPARPPINAPAPAGGGGTGESSTPDGTSNTIGGVARPKGETPAQTKGKPKAKPKPKMPELWHREGARKTFARVYIGDNNSLELVSLHVSVIVEGPRARTLVDHVFRNPHDRQLEGTFEYPLPPGASPSYYAMFLGQTRESLPARRFKPQPEIPGKKTLPPEALAPAQLARQIDAADWGRLQEARLVPPQRAVEAYEEVVRSRIDPGLLEYASGNTFRGRVFPIQPRGYNRVLIAYEETLPVADGQLLYRFDLPGCKLHEMRFSLQFDPREAKDPVFRPKEARKESDRDRVAFSHTWSNTTPQGAVTFSVTPADATVQSGSGRQGDTGPVYLYSRLRPTLPEVDKPQPFAEHAVFLLDTSLSEQSGRFDVSVKLLQAILETDPSIKQFNVLAFNAAAAWVAPKGWLPNTKEGREQALQQLDGVLLEGATDLSAALEKLVALDFPLPIGAGLSCFLLSDGHLTWGQTEVAPLVARFRQRCPQPTRFCCYRTGLGEESAELYDALTRDGGGTFQCFGKAEVAAAAKAHLHQCLHIDSVRFEGEPALAELLVAGRRSAVYPGGELIVTGHATKPGKGKLVLQGSFAGKPFSQSFPVECTGDGELAPRGWGEVAVASLLALNDPWLDGLVTAYCQQFNIGSRAASFLVLENEADYKRFDLQKEKGRTIKGDLRRYLDDTWTLLAKEPSYKKALGQLIYQIDGRTGVLTGKAGKSVEQLLGLLGEEDCTLPIGDLKGALLKEKDATAAYLSARKADRRSVHAYLEECQRRHADNDVDGAVRVLSSIVEEHPGRGDALRLVGYRLLDLGQPALAAGLFSRVLRQRPFEPHSFRDLARSLEDAGRYPLAALLNEAVLAGKWHNRFGEAIKVVTREDQVRLLRAGLREGKLNSKQSDFFKTRLKELGEAEVSADLRVSITWNSDATDVDLHVIEPSGFKVYYSQPKSPSGGVLSQDMTQGYGPERYHVRRAQKGEYRILVHYFRTNPNLLGGETHVNVVITRHAGTAREKVERRTVILKRHQEMKEVIRLRF